MKPSLTTFLFVFTCIFAPFVVFAQPANDDCADATELIINQQCFITSVTTIGATHSTPEAFCVGADDDDDVWFKFVAISTTHNITLLCLGSFDGILEASSGNCTAFANLGCSNTAGAGAQEGIALTALTIGATYYLRVYSATSSPTAQGDAYICVQETNDICANAFEVIPAIDCMDGLGGQTRLTDPSNALPASPCAGDADDDVWYKFVATQSAHTIRMECYDFDGVLEIRSGGCGSQTNLACANAQGINFPEEIFLNNLIAGNTYYIRVWSVGSGVAAQGDFYVCIDIPVVVPPNDDCSTAEILTAAATCNYTAGSTLNTQSGGGGFCGNANADDDVWYSFVATQTDYTVQLNCLGSFDGVMEISESDGTCTNFINLNCYNDGGPGAPETAIYNGLQVGTTYLIRIYSFGGAGSEGNFEICLIANAGLPTNDDCGGAIVLTPGQTCNYTAGTTQLAINNPGTPVDCPIGNADDDVWYKFTATYSAMTIHLNCMGAFNGVIETMLGLNGGDCTGFIGAGCSNNTGAGQPEEIQMTGLSVGDTYFIHIWSFGGTGSEGDFEVCVQEPLVPTNDNCAQALLLIPSGNSGCNATAGTTENATNSAPAGSCGGDPDDDVWYRFVATNSLHLVKLTCSAGFDGVLEVRSGSCGSQSNLSCANNLGAGGTEEILPSGFTIGTTYYVRVWSFGGSGNQGSYEVCIITALPNDICQSATLVTPNTNSSCANVTNGTTVGATTSSPAYCNPGNNYPDVWYKFVATNTTHIINVTGNGVFPYIEVYEDCGGGAIECIGIGFDEFVSGAADNLSIGSTYYVRIYMGGSTGAFSLCIAEPQQNDECSNAETLTVGNGSCTNSVNGSTTNTVPSSGIMSSCGNPDDDVWYKFVATGTIVNVLVAPSATLDAAFQVFSGSCAALAQLVCINGGSGNESTQLIGLTVSSTYYIRVFSAPGSAQGQGTFSICVNTPAPPANDECSGAFVLNLTTMGSVCSYTPVNTLSATQSGQALSCTTMGYEDDVWCTFTTNTYYTFTFSYTSLNSYPAGSTTIGMEIYTGDCSGLTPVTDGCFSSFGLGSTGSVNAYLHPNTTYYVRLWVPGTNRGTFSFCVQRTTANCQMNSSGLLLGSQADVDNFPIIFPNCINVPVSINIGSPSPDPIYNLDRLEQINTIDRNLYISNSSLTSMSGLSNLDSLGGGLGIYNNAVTTLNGLNNLETIKVGISIEGNPNLTDISALSNASDFRGVSIANNPVLNNLTGINVATLTWNLEITGNQMLTSLIGLEAIHTITGDLIIRENAVLENLTGLGGLTTIGSSSVSNDGMFVTANPSLTDFTGLTNLTQINGNAWIVNNNALTNMNGLDNLTTIGDKLVISENDNLLNLNGLNNLNTIGGALFIGGPAFDNGFSSQLLDGNPTLTDLTALSDLISIGGELFIYDNIALMNLTGLNNINPATITYLILQNSNVLSFCEVPSICNYLANPSNPAFIQGNATNCNSRAEVQAACAIILPLQLLSFTANNLPKTNEITWITAIERNVSQHILERSADGLSNWQEINRQAGALQSDTERKYQYEDTKPLLISYYRLRSVDVDGTEQLSKIVSVTRAGKGLAISATYPVPVTDELTMVFTAFEESEVALQITDLTGRVLETYSISANSGANQALIPFKGFANGLYLIVLRNADTVSEIWPVVKH